MKRGTLLKLLGVAPLVPMIPLPAPAQIVEDVFVAPMVMSGGFIPETDIELFADQFGLTRKWSPTWKTGYLSDTSRGGYSEADHVLAKRLIQHINYPRRN